MDKFLVNGPTRLDGRVVISGAKNAAIAIIPATLLVEGKSYIENVPRIGDVLVYQRLISELGAKVTRDSGEIEIDASSLDNPDLEDGLISKMRASYYLLGVLLARFGRAAVGLPGGCNIGLRPIDQHLKGFEALGADVDVSHGLVKVQAKKLVGATIYLDVASVGATINIMFAASRAEGMTVIENAAKEPEIIDVANFLNNIGAKVKGAGTDTIRIEGSKDLQGCRYSIIPDRIEAGTFMIAALATNGDVTVENVIPKHLESVTAKLRETGALVEIGEESVRIVGSGAMHGVDVKTLGYPGYPTDLQAQIMTALTKADGTSLITEGVFEKRFQHVEELKKMGANIKVEGRLAIVKGVPKLTEAKVKARDLRAGAALMIAGCMAEGQTEVSGIHHINRGYEDVLKKFNELGASIKCVANDSEEE